MNLLYIAVGGALGAVLRYLAGNALSCRLGVVAAAFGVLAVKILI